MIELRDLRELLWHIDGEIERIGWGVPPVLALVVVPHEEQVKLRTVPGYEMALDSLGDSGDAIAAIANVFTEVPPAIKSAWFDGDIGIAEGVVFIGEAIMLRREDMATLFPPALEIVSHPLSVKVRVTTLVTRSGSTHVLVHERDGIAQLSEVGEVVTGRVVADMNRLMRAIL